MGAPPSGRNPFFIRSSIQSGTNINFTGCCTRSQSLLHQVINSVSRTRNATNSGQLHDPLREPRSSGLFLSFRAPFRLRQPSANTRFSRRANPSSPQLPYSRNFQHLSRGSFWPHRFSLARSMPRSDDHPMKTSSSTKNLPPAPEESASRRHFSHTK